jgi:hypothetical protein
MSYGSITLRSAVLRDKNLLNCFVAKGYKFIRQAPRLYNNILRNPTSGCYVELTYFKEILSVPIDSKKAHNLIYRHSYF